MLSHVYLSPREQAQGRALGCDCPLARSAYRTRLEERGVPSAPATLQREGVQSSPQGAQLTDYLLRTPRARRGYRRGTLGSWARVKSGFVCPLLLNV